MLLSLAGLVADVARGKVLPHKARMALMGVDLASILAIQPWGLGLVLGSGAATSAEAGASGGGLAGGAALLYAVIFFWLALVSFKSVQRPLGWLQQIEAAEKDEDGK